MKQIESAEAELQFFLMIDEVEKGASFVIMRNGIPAVLLVPVQSESSQVDLGRRD